MDNDMVEVQKIDGKVMTTSLEVAKRFNKEHKNVLRDIDQLLENTVEAWRLNFELSTYLDIRGKEQRMYYLTRDGFAVVAMGFTGKEALEWKFKYLDAFRKMEEFILRHCVADDDKLREWGEMRRITKRERKEFTDVLKEFLIPLAVSQGSQNSGKLYMNYTKLLNKAFVEDTGFSIPKGNTVRDYLDIVDLISFQNAERRLGKEIHQMVEKGIHYKEIYKHCKEAVEKWIDVLGRVSPKLPRRGPVPSLGEPIKKQLDLFGEQH